MPNEVDRYANDPLDGPAQFKDMLKGFERRIAELERSLPSLTELTLYDTAGVAFHYLGTGIGFNGAAPQAQGVPIANATNAATVITQLNLLLAYLRLRGDIDI